MTRLESTRFSSIRSLSPSRRLKREVRMTDSFLRCLMSDGALLSVCMSVLAAACAWGLRATRCMMISVFPWLSEALAAKEEVNSFHPLSDEAHWPAI